MHFHLSEILNVGLSLVQEYFYKVILLSTSSTTNYTYKHVCAHSLH